MLTRVFSALLISAVLAAMVRFLPKTHRNIVFIVTILALPSTGFFLLASINPSSWTVFGTGFAWIALHAAITNGDLLRSCRWRLLGLSGISSLMALGSRWDAWGFVLFILCLVGFEGAWYRFPLRRKRVIALVTIMPIAGWFLLAQLNPISPKLVDVLISYEKGQPNNLDFFTTYLLYGVPNALESLGTLPTTSPFKMPDIVLVVNVAVLGTLAYLARNRRTFLQLTGTIIALLAMTVVIMAQVALIDNRDSEGIEPRYSLPLLTFAVGWWFLHSSTISIEQTVARLKSLTWLIAGTYALVAYAIAERSTDVQTSGLRPLPEGPDQWWWSSIPVGPNAVLALCILSFVLFLRSAVTSMSADDSGLLKCSQSQMSEEKAAR